MAKKIQGNVFLLHQRLHTKIQAILARIGKSTQKLTRTVMQSALLI